MPSVVVTGVSTGIGWGIAKVLVARGFHVFGSVRRQSDADRLQAEFGPAFTPLLMDVTDRESVVRAAAQVEAALGDATLAGLVNNAGISVPGPLLYLPLEDLRRQLEVNLVAQISVTQVFAPLLGADPKRAGKPGRIVNIGSIWGEIGVPFVGAYVASKFALEGISESLRRELLVHGIDVIVIRPGAVVTAIWDKAEAEDMSLYLKTEYGPILTRLREYMLREGRKGLTPERLGEATYVALTAKRPRVQYAVVPEKFKNWIVPRWLPKRMVDRRVDKQMGLSAARVK
jgi:NAD(P)-dependent dehydrogenase (short-subunit alcohol dehydrogenase family)